ncbi:MAG: hypothetical protein ACKOB8_14095 [Mycobacterium sp.]
MVIGAVVSLCLAALIGGSGLWTLARRPGIDLTAQVLRSVAPTQLAAAVMLAIGAVTALAAPAAIGRAGLIIGGLGAFATIAAGSWQGARFAARRRTAVGGCSGGTVGGTVDCGAGQACAGCTRLCR